MASHVLCWIDGRGKGGNRGAGQVASINVGTQRTTSRYSPQAVSIPVLNWELPLGVWRLRGPPVEVSRLASGIGWSTESTSLLLFRLSSCTYGYLARRWASKRGTRGDAIATEANPYAGYGQRPPSRLASQKLPITEEPDTLSVYDRPVAKNGKSIVETRNAHYLPVYETWNVVIGGVWEEPGSRWWFSPPQWTTRRLHSRLDLSTG
ncbi:hypothetical protein F5Y14DRAFT_304879 [Nemania sp. NC0429]|nr:hypothetical protein F5Y14DRAFT_304879 [Nemania sp. NC0429]